VVHFGVEVQGEFGDGDGMVFSPHVVGEGVGDGGCVEHAGLLGLPEIEEIATFAALVEGTELGAEEFGGGVDG
jgi:hypothetical protein